MPLEKKEKAEHKRNEKYTRHPDTLEACVCYLLAGETSSSLAHLSLTFHVPFKVSYICESIQINNILIAIDPFTT